MPLAPGSGIAQNLYARGIGPRRPPEIPTPDLPFSAHGPQGTVCRPCPTSSRTPKAPD